LHDCIINFAGAFFKSKVTLEYIKDQRQQNSAGTRQKICMVLSLSHTKNGCCSPGYFFVVCRKISIPTGKEPFKQGFKQWQMETPLLRES
jgi:hypothetical protein